MAGPGRPAVDAEAYLRGQFAAWLAATTSCVDAHAQFGANILPVLKSAIADMDARLGPRLALLPVQVMAGPPAPSIISADGGPARNPDDGSGNPPAEG